MFIVQRHKKKINALPIRQASLNEWLIYECNHGTGNDEGSNESYADIIKQLIEQSKRIYALETASNTANIPAAKVRYVDLLANAWDGATSPYSQVVAIEGVTENSQVDLTPSAEQLSIFYEKDLTFVTENVSGIVTVYALGQKPQNDYTIQATITEVV